jgi:hypothetical protein
MFIFLVLFLLRHLLCSTFTIRDPELAEALVEGQPELVEALAEGQPELVEGYTTFSSRTR